MTMVMMAMISAMMIVTKYSLPTIDSATRYSTRYSDFLLQPYSKGKKPTRLCLAGIQWNIHVCAEECLSLKNKHRAAFDSMGGTFRAVMSESTSTPRHQH